MSFFDPLNRIIRLRHKKREHTESSAINKPDGTKEWRHNGVLHRTDGPAVIKPNKTYQWWVDGKQVHNNKEFFQLSKCSYEDLADMVKRYGPIR